MSDPIRPVGEVVPPCSHPEVPPPLDRRSFLVWAAAASLGASVLFMGATVVQALMPPSRSIEGKTKVGKLAVAKATELEVGVPKLAEYGDDVVFVIKKDESTFTVFNAACPHVRCKLQYNSATNEFDCPCHASSFDINGTRLGGPAPRDMYAGYFEFTNGEIVVSGLEG